MRSASRLIGTIRRECLVDERHLEPSCWSGWQHYNQGRPHASPGPGIPDVPVDRLARPTNIVWNRWQHEP